MKYIKKQAKCLIKPLELALLIFNYSLAKDKDINIYLRRFTIELCLM